MGLRWGLDFEIYSLPLALGLEPTSDGWHFGQQCGLTRIIAEAKHWLTESEGGLGWTGPQRLSSSKPDLLHPTSRLRSVLTNALHAPCGKQKLEVSAGNPRNPKRSWAFVATKHCGGFQSWRRRSLSLSCAQEPALVPRNCSRLGAGCRERGAALIHAER